MPEVTGGRATLAVLAAALAGCAHAAAGCDLETPYEDAVAHWTARAEVYQLLDQRAAFNATVESRVFREQRARERGRELGLPVEAITADVQKEIAASDAATSFVVGAYTDRVRDNNLADKVSLWRIALETQAGELAPTKVALIGRPDDNLRKLYPYLDPFQKVYRIEFPRVAQGPVTLRIASGQGIADLKFERL